jgi:hypothetical protein
MRLKRYALLLSVSALVVGCGKGNGTATSPSKAVAPYNNTITGSVDVFGSVRHALPIPRAGNMTITLTWQDPSVDLDLDLASSTCVNLYPKAACGVLQSSSTGFGTTTERIARSVLVGESYNVFVDNFSASKTQAYSLTVTIQ